MTYEAEIQALFEGCKEAIWLKRFSQEVLGISYKLITINCDNQAAITTVKAKEILFNARMKHLDRQKDFIRNYIQERYIDIKHVRLEDQRVDILTKVLYVPQIKHLLISLGLIRV